MRLNRISKPLSSHWRIAVVAAGLVCSWAAARSDPPAGSRPDLATILAQPKPILTIDRRQTRTRGELVVTSTTLGLSGRFPIANTGYGASVSPAVAWTRGPDGTVAYYLIMEDSTVGRERKGVLHWQLFNIPASVLSLAEGAATTAGATLGSNVEGHAAYTGPHAPAGGPAFHYHIQVFALDRRIELPSGASREALWLAIDGHVLAAGQVVGEFQGPAAESRSAP